MKHTATSLGLAVLLGGLAACDGSFDDRFEEACASATNMSEEVCECMADRADEELTDDAKTMLLATLEGDDEAAAEARGRLGMADAVEVGMFMTQAGECVLSRGEGEGSS